MPSSSDAEAAMLWVSLTTVMGSARRVAARMRNSAVVFMFIFMGVFCLCEGHRCQYEGAKARHAEDEKGRFTSKRASIQIDSEESNSLDGQKHADGSQVFHGASSKMFSTRVALSGSWCARIASIPPSSPNLQQVAMFTGVIWKPR